MCLIRQLLNHHVLTLTILLLVEGGKNVSLSLMRKKSAFFLSNG